MATAKKETGEDRMELFPVETLKKKYDTTDVIFSGVSVKNGWSIGRQITENEYTKAVAEFLKAPLGRR